MGQNISSQPKLSGEITLNRIRSTCQRDDKMPADLKNFNVSLLANDLNTLGMNIPIVNANGSKRSADDICYDIKRVAHPDVESICMINNKREAHQAIESMVDSFNKNYGARIQLYKDPLNKSKGKRNTAEVCDDLYLVLDKVHRKLTDQPKVIKQKLEDMISQLEERKEHIQSRMLPVIQNIQNAREHDQTDEKIKQADTLYNATNSLLNAQLRSAYNLTANTIKEISPESLNINETNNPGLTGNLSNLKSNLHSYEKNRWSTNKPVTDVTKNLLAASVASGLAINDCQKCMGKLGAKAGDLSSDEITRHENLRAKLAVALSKHNLNDAEITELYNCYSSLTKEAGCSDITSNKDTFIKARSGLGKGTLGTDTDQDVLSLIGETVKNYRSSPTSGTAALFGSSPQPKPPAISSLSTAGVITSTTK